MIIDCRIELVILIRSLLRRLMISNSWEFVFFCLAYIFLVKVQEFACSASYGKNKTLIPNITNKRNLRRQFPPSAQRAVIETYPGFKIAPKVTDSKKRNK